MEALEKIMLDELEKALSEQKHELKEAIENLAKNYQLTMQQVEKFERENSEILQIAEAAARSNMTMIQIMKDLHIWLGSIRDRFTAADSEYTAYNDIMTALASFVTSKPAIEAGVIENAQH